MTDCGTIGDSEDWRPEPAALELMEEAVDGAVERIIGIAEWEAQRGVAPGEALVLELLRVVDQRIEDAERMVACGARHARCMTGLGALRRRRDRLEALRSRGAL